MHNLNAPECWQVEIFELAQNNLVKYNRWKISYLDNQYEAATGSKMFRRNGRSSQWKVVEMEGPRNGRSSS